MSPNRPGRFLHIYCDESRQTADRYMVIGGVIAQREDELLFTQAMTLFRQSQNMRSELKRSELTWTKVSDQKLSEYGALIDLFFSLNRAVYFKAIVIDTQEIDHTYFMPSDVVTSKQPVQKLSYYVDETGQDTEGTLFIVAMGVAKGDQDTLRTLLRQCEQASGKGKKKWTKATSKQRQAYMESVVQETAFQRRLFFCRFHETREYLTCLCESIARVIATIAGTPPAPVAVFIDGLGRNERHKVGTLLRRRQITVDKVRGLRDESDELIRLADAGAGFVRDQFEEAIYPQLYQRAIHRGVIQEV